MNDLTIALAGRRLRFAILRWYRAHGRDLPWRRTRDPYRILVSEVMLQQTQVERVIPKYERFLERFPTAMRLARAQVGDVLRIWSGLGYNGRAKRLWECARELVRPGGSRLNSDPASMRSLPGVGRYTAAALACFAFDAPVAFVDTNVRRVLSRAVDGVDDVGERRAWEIAAEIAPRAGSAAWHHALMDVGALYCRPMPRCGICPARASCRFATAGGMSRSKRPASRPRQRAFRDSRRYYRGRIVKSLGASRGMSLRALGEQVKPGFKKTDMPWLVDLLSALRAEGLVELDAARGRARLP